jgi:hypothetical protein
LVNINQLNKFIKHVSEMLNLPVSDIDVNDETITISNYCEKHNMFEIKKII